MKWNVSEQQYETLQAWELAGEPAVEPLVERTELALIICGTYFDGLFTFAEVQERLDRLFGRSK